MLEQNRMSEEQFTNISMAVLLTGLILFMGFIIWDLGKKSNAGRFGMFVLFLALGFGVTGVLGSLGHYCLTRAFHTADISATQSLRFLDLVWASLLGWLVFADVPSSSTWAGALVILLSTVWIARRESRR